MKLVSSLLLGTLVGVSYGFVLDEITMDAATYEACSTCDGRADRAGNLAVSQALKQYMEKNHVKFAIESGDVKLTEGLPNQRVDTGHSCTKTAEARGVTITAEMVNDNDELDSMAINYFEMTKLAFLSGDVPHKVTFRADIRVWLGFKLFGDCKNYGRKTCATEATSTGINKVLVTLSASDYQTYTIGGQDYLEFKLGIQVENILEDSATYAPMSAPRGSGCNLEVLGIKIDSIDKYIQRGANSYLKSQVNKVNELRGPKLIQRLEDVLQAKLGSVVTIPVNITGVNGRRKRQAGERCQRMECPSGFFRIGNTQRCQKTFGTTAPNCSQYGQNAELETTKIAGGSITIFSCHVDMVPI